LALSPGKFSAGVLNIALIPFIDFIYFIKSKVVPKPKLIHGNFRHNEVTYELLIEYIN
jgi:hypothetical protein